MKKCTCSEGFNPLCEFDKHNISEQFYISYGKDKVIWGAGESDRESMEDALNNIRDYIVIIPENCIPDYTVRFSKEAREKIVQISQFELIKSIKLRTILCSRDLYLYILANGAEDFYEWKIKNGIAVML